MESWSEPSVLWIAAVGDPSSSKIPAAGPVLRAIDDVERKLGRDFENVHRTWETEAEVARTKEASWKKEVQDAVKNGVFPPKKTPECEIPEEPVPPRIMASDATPEALAKLIKANPKGLLYYNDELAGWSGNINRYTNGDNKPMWLSAHGARSHVIDRKSHKPIHISHFAMSVFGGIQPDKLKRCFLDGDDDGLAARILWFWPDSVALTRPQSGASHDFICQAFDRLSELQPSLDSDGYPQPTTLNLTEDAQTLFHDWRCTHREDLKATAGPLASAYGKHYGALLRVALMLELMFWCAHGGLEPTTIPKETIEKAIAFFDKYAKPMAARVFGDAALPIAERQAATLAKWLLANDRTDFNAREVRRTAGLPGLSNSKAFDAATTILVEAGWIRLTGKTAALGRKPKNFDVNPAIKQLKA